VHETILAGQILRAALAQGGGRKDARITRLVVRVGELDAVSHEALRTAFRYQAQGTTAGHAEFLVESVPASLVCERCGHSEPVRDTRDANVCTHCGNTRLRLDGRGWTLSVVRGPW